jgi:hypothetical protein
VLLAVVLIVVPNVFEPSRTAIGVHDRTGCRSSVSIHDTYAARRLALVRLSGSLSTCPSRCSRS